MAAKGKDKEDNEERKSLKEEKEHNDEEQIDKKGDVAVLKKKIEYLEEELVRKDKEMQKLKQENIILFKTALKHSERKVENKIIEEKKS